MIPAVVASSRMRRNSSRNRCSAVIVTFDSSSPTHHPPGSCNSSRRRVPASMACSSPAAVPTLIVPTISRAACSRRRRAAARPLRIAPSIVAGQPVAVQAPARATFGLCRLRPRAERCRPGARRERRLGLPAYARPDKLGGAEALGQRSVHQIDKLATSGRSQIRSAARDDRQVLSAPLRHVTSQGAAIEDPVGRASEKRRQRLLEDLAVDQQVDAHDGRVGQPGGRLAEQLGALARWECNDERVPCNALPVGEHHLVTIERGHAGA